jgi:hypothetical protein
VNVGGGVRVSPVINVSRGCPGRNAEAETATAAPAYVYVAWIGCGGIGFARSADGGATFGPPAVMAGSAGHTWDPAIAVAPDGTVYVAYMRRAGGYYFPVVAASFDHGASFPQVTGVRPPARGNFGDRDFLAVSPSGAVYLTWDYGPAGGEVHTLCSAGGSCAFSSGDLNAVVQRSSDRGRTWGPITPVGPGFPRNGGDAAPVVATPDGRVHVLYLGHGISPGTFRVHPGHEFYTSSPDGRRWPRRAQELWPQAGAVALDEWWIDASLGTDAQGGLYASWDTQTPAGDTGWLSASANGGRSWRPPVRVTGSRAQDPHVMSVIGGGRAVAHVAWLTDASGPGYAVYLRTYSLIGGWRGPAVRVSPGFGNPRIWPGDTIGLAALPGHAAGGGPVRLAVSWGSAVGQARASQIYTAVVTLP